MAKTRRGFSIVQNISLFTMIVVIVSLLTVSTLLSLTFTSNTNVLVEDTSNEINKQVIMNYENYIDSVIDTTDYIQQKVVEYGLLEINDQLDGIFRNAAEQQKDIATIMLYDISGNVIAQSTTKPLIAQDITVRDFFENAVFENTIYHFSSPHIQEIVQDNNDLVITISKMVDYYDSNNRSSGILIVDINISRIVELSDKTNLGDQGHIVILNNDNTLIYTNNSSCYSGECESIDIIESIIIGGRSVEIDESNFYVNVNTLGKTRWQIATFINIDILQQTSRQTLIISIAILSATLVLTAVLSYSIAKRISNPIYRLQKHMKVVEKGDFGTFEVTGQKEVVDLGNSFNKLQEEIKTLMDSLVFEQKEKRKSEFRALQTQINPHFLYNTLDSIVYLSEKGENEKVQEMVIALSRFFRISISRGKNIIPLKEELEHAKNYLLIQQIRYNEKFTYRFDVNPNTYQYAVVKLILQPLIENAIYHGINTEVEQGKIEIRSFIEGDKLILEVENDGYGITEEKIAELYDVISQPDDSRSVGLKNVYQRIKLYYGEQSNFIISSVLDEKTVIRIELPKEKVVI